MRRVFAAVLAALFEVKATPRLSEGFLDLRLTQLRHRLETALRNDPSSFVEQGAYFQLARVYQRLHHQTAVQNELTKQKELNATEAKTIAQADQAGAHR